jgi:hypothetical protein
MISLSSWNEIPAAGSQKITQITIPAALMTAWARDLFGKDIMYRTGIAA